MIWLLYLFGMTAAIVAYGIIGQAIGMASLRVWRRTGFADDRFRAGWSRERTAFYLLFPLSATVALPDDKGRDGSGFARVTREDISSGLVTRTMRPLYWSESPASHAISSGDEEEYLRYMAFVWPLKVAWNASFIAVTAPVLVAAWASRRAWRAVPVLSARGHRASPGKASRPKVAGMTKVESLTMLIAERHRERRASRSGVLSAQDDIMLKWAIAAEKTKEDARIVN